MENDKVAIELADGLSNLDILISEIARDNLDFGEAETRFHIIDRLIMSCFGWDRGKITVERSAHSSYTDYELGHPIKFIWEAKKENDVFEIPSKSSGRLIQKLASIFASSKDAKKAILQANKYCNDRGVVYAVVTNGHQLIIFKQFRPVDDPGSNVCIAFRSLEHIKAHFSEAWEYLSYSGAETDQIGRALRDAQAPRPPIKLSSNIPNYPQFIQPSDLQRSMKDMAELVLMSADIQPELEKQFYEECYCQSGTLSQHALISKQMLNARYASLFPSASDGPKIEPATAKGGRYNLTPEILADAMSSRPITLVGDVGVGKSSFLKHLKYVSAYDEFEHAMYAYVDLGRKGALSISVRDAILEQIEDAFLHSYQIDIYDSQFVRTIYKKDITRFERSIWGELRETNPEQYAIKLIEKLDELQNDKEKHLRKSVSHLAKERRKQIIIAIDNSDQRSSDVQQDAFVISQNLASEWRATVFVSVRPKTFFYSKRSGAFSAYPNRVFTISPPRVDQVIERRLQFGIAIAEGRVQLNQLKEISFRLGNLSTIIRIIVDSIDRNDDIKIYLENITAGNIRELVAIIVDMFGNPNVDLSGAVYELERTGGFQIPLHDFWKAIFRGDYHYYDPLRSSVENLFDVHTNEPREHFLLPLILGLLEEDAPRRDGEGFIDVATIFGKMQDLGFRSASTETALRRANNKKLIEAPERITIEEDVDGVFDQFPEKFRITSIGVYHLQKWMTSFSYIDAMCVDTPIFDNRLRTEIAQTIRSQALADRYKRAIDMRDYFTDIWSDMNIEISFFDWNDHVANTASSFERVQHAIQKYSANTK